MISGVAVVVPAADEQERVAACLRSVRAALCRVSRPERRVLLVLALNGCTDGTEAEARAADPDLDLVHLDGRCVGAARRVGTERALNLLAGLPPEQVWLASTDADGTVPEDWLERQLRYAERGLEAVAGLVDVTDWGDRPPELARRFADYLETTGRGHGHPHVHGANLGMTAAAYRRAGGWPALASGEDVALWRELGERGVRLAKVDDVVVTTSARRDSRAPGGFAGLLDALGEGARGGTGAPRSAYP